MELSVLSHQLRRVNSYTAPTVFVLKRIKHSQSCDPLTVTSAHSAHEGDKVLSLTDRPPLSSGNILGTHIFLETESTPGP